MSTFPTIPYSTSVTSHVSYSQGEERADGRAWRFLHRCSRAKSWRWSAKADPARPRPRRPSSACLQENGRVEIRRHPPQRRGYQPLERKAPAIDPRRSRQPNPAGSWQFPQPGPDHRRAGARDPPNYGRRDRPHRPIARLSSCSPHVGISQPELRDTPIPPRAFRRHEAAGADRHRHRS